MLTKTQLEKLESYSKHEKYGKILQDAIEGWKIVNPNLYTYGIFFNPIRVCYQYDYRMDGACLIGSALCNKHFRKIPKSLEDATFICYNISAHEHISLVSGFDSSVDIHPIIKEWDHDAYMFGFEIGKIIFDIRNEQNI